MSRPPPKTRSRSTAARPPAERQDPVTAYARSVVAGATIAGPLVRLACQRHLTDLETGPARGLTWSLTHADRVLGFFPEILRLAEGAHAGQPFVLQPWQQFVVGCLFGWLGPDGHRRFRTCYAEIGKGNGKSPLAAGIGLYGLVGDGEAAAQIYSAATSREQAKIVWGDAQKMVQASPALSAQVDETVNNLAFVATSSFFRPVSSDSSRLDGFRPHMVIADEVHEHPNGFVIDKMRAGFKGRRQPLMVEITNSGFDRHSICWEHHEYSRKVLEGVIENDSWFGFVCGLAEGDDWRDERVWLKANPNLGVSITEKYLREQVQEAMDLPSKENIVKRLNFCVWTEQSVRLIPLESWDRGAGPIDLAALAGRRCYGGLDLARVEDMSGLALVFPPLTPEEPWQAVVKYWIPEDNIQDRVRRDKVPYDVWVRQGLVATTPGNATDFDFIQAAILAVCQEFDVQEIAYDRTFADSLVSRLTEEGVTMVPFGQGFLSMAAPTAELLRMVKAGELQHGGNPVLRWNASNLAGAQDAAGNIKPDKGKSTERIDGVVALIMAIGRAMVSTTERSIYDSEGITWL